MTDSIFDDTMADMTSPEIEQAAREDASILLPVGVIEEHGPHLCLGTDIYLAHALCRKVRDRLSALGLPALIAPPFYWGINFITGAFPGSFTVRRSTLRAMLVDLLASLKRWDFENVFLLNLHGDPQHNLAILDAVEEARTDHGIRAQVLLTPHDVRRFGLGGQEPNLLVHESCLGLEHSDGFADLHGGAFETSVMAALFPELVNQELARTLPSSRTTAEDLKTWRKGWSDARRITPLGYCGDPSWIDAEGAARAMEAQAEAISGAIASFLTGSPAPPRGD